MKKSLESLSLSGDNLVEIRQRLLAWFKKHARDLPWRRSTDPYRVWISEVMLQQTQVATVIPYYQRFLARFPDVQNLAAASEAEVLRLWEGLGYYRRARQLHAAAGAIVTRHGSVFPRTFAEVRALPGIGRYTAGAILSIACDQRLPILEANTIRLLSRLAAFRGDPASGAGQKLLWQLATNLLPEKAGSGRLNQALMELGALVCTPKAPRCTECPLATLCPTNARGLQAVIPRAKRPPKWEERSEAAVVIVREKKVLLRQCAPGERWAGLWDFMRFEIALHQAPTSDSDQIIRERELVAEILDRTGLAIEIERRLTTIRHGVTRFRITLDVFAAAVRRGKIKSSANLRWISLTQLADLPLSTTGRKIARLLAGSIAAKA